MLDQDRAGLITFLSESAQDLARAAAGADAVQARQLRDAAEEYTHLRERLIRRYHAEAQLDLALSHPDAA